jgi:hypothetical protein
MPFITTRKNHFCTSTDTLQDSTSAVGLGIRISGYLREVESTKRRIRRHSAVKGWDLRALLVDFFHERRKRKDGAVDLQRRFRGWLSSSADRGARIERPTSGHMC